MVELQLPCPIASANQIPTVGEAKGIADRAAAIRVFAAKQGWSQAQKGQIAAIEIRANAKLGELLKVMPKQAGARDGGKKSSSRGSFTELRGNGVATLTELGVTKKQSHTAQRVDSIPAAKREKFIAENIDKPDKLSVTAIMRLAKEQQREGR